MIGQEKKTFLPLPLSTKLLVGSFAAALPGFYLSMDRFNPAYMPTFGNNPVTWSFLTSVSLYVASSVAKKTNH